MTIEMKKKVRAAIVGLLFGFAFILLCSAPSDDADSWYLAFFVSKGLAFLLGYAAYVLAGHWESKGLLPDDFCEE